MNIKIKSPPPFIKVDYYKTMRKSKSQTKDLYMYNYHRIFNPFIPKIKSYINNIPKEPKIYYFNNNIIINNSLKVKEHFTNTSTQKKNFNSFSKGLEKELFDFIYPLQIQNISFKKPLHKHLSHKTLINTKKIINEDDYRYLEPKINIDEILINQKNNRNYFKNKNLIRKYHLKRSLLLDKISKNITLNPFPKPLKKTKVSLYCIENEFFNKKFKE